MDNRRLTPLILALGLIAGAGAAQDVTLTVDADEERRDELRPVLRAASLTFALRRDDEAEPQDFVAAARADYERLLTGLYAQGHYGGRISIRIDGREAATIPPLDAPARIDTVEIVVEPGPLFTFGRAEIAPLPAGAVVPEGFAPGAVARSGAVGDAVRAGIGAWRDAGHATAAPAGQTITARHPASELDASVRLDPGPRLTFGALGVSGNSAVRTERIVAIAGVKAGRVFSPDHLDEAADRLRRTGAFSSVAMVEGTPTADLTLPITAQVAEQTPRRIGVGAELSSTEGLALSAFWLHRNLLGGAERFRLEGEVTGIGGETGGTDYALGASFNRPATIGPLNDFYATGRIERVDDPGFFLDQIALEAGFSRRLSPTLSGEVGVGLLAAEVEDALGARSYVYLTLPVSATWDRRNDPLDPTGGFYIEADLTPFVETTDGVAGGRLYADARAYRSFGAEDRVTLAARGQLGAVFGVEAGDAPADFLFYSGGGGTVRGQPYQSLAVDLGGGLEIGGRFFAGAQFEARVGITERIGAVAFYDTALVGPDPFSDTGSEWHAGAGLGVRYDTGIGPLRLDVGVPTTGDKAGEAVQVYIGIGQAF